MDEKNSYSLPKRPKLHVLQKRTKMTRVPCRERGENSEPRAQKFGDLMKADHKILNEGSRSSHTRKRVDKIFLSNL